MIFFINPLFISALCFFFMFFFIFFFMFFFRSKKFNKISTTYVDGFIQLRLLSCSTDQVIDPYQKNLKVL